MRYCNLLKMTFEEAPILEEIYYKEKDINLIDKNSGNHVVFGTIFTPFVSKLLTNPLGDNRYKLIEIFNFFNRMAICPDEKVREVLMYSVLEILGDNKELLNNAYIYMSDEVKDLSLNIEKFLGR